MIANQIDDGWEIIYQPAHALLSAQLAARWRAAARPLRWWETLNAIAQHDNGWIEWETSPSVNEEGKPRNFTEILPRDAIAQWRRGVARGRHQGRWVGLLISRHATSLYESRRGETAELDRFLDEQLSLQEQWAREIGAAEVEIAQAYAMIRWSDWLSLILCWHRLPEPGTAISVGEGADSVHYEAQRLEDLIVVDPWPFDEEYFPVSVEARLIRGMTFSGDDALRQALERAGIVTRRWVLASPGAVTRKEI